MDPECIAACETPAEKQAGNRVWRARVEFPANKACCFTLCLPLSSRTRMDKLADDSFPEFLLAREIPGAQMEFEPKLSSLFRYGLHFIGNPVLCCSFGALPMGAKGRPANSAKGRAA